MAERLLIRVMKGGNHAKIVTLNGKKITKMPSSLENLTGLRSLDFQNNQIFKVCPQLSTLTQLTFLNLGNNFLEEVPEEIKYITSLKKLHLFGNRISKFPPEVCDGLQNLILLNLNNNKLTWLPEEVGRLRSLMYLSLNCNQLTSIPRQLCFLKNLSELCLNYNQLSCIPEDIKYLTKLQRLSLARNNIEFLPEFQDLKLQEFYCEENPLFQKQPIIADQQEDLWNLREITARFIMNQLEEKNSFIMHAIEEYPDIKDKISKGKRCVICGKSFLTTWLECVQFVSPSKAWKISKNLKLIPLQVLLCSQKCFCERGPNIFGIA
ncbi:leucine-rich repeat-containing protein 69 isoform X2 [Dipodomys merriami]|uniref:leucine-rich repeat-containing protein 69 isoform X2 n=1 Tax=Dipodomys merriami TaxID=94247 RepID=UPI003855ED97